jgi:hemoglobin
MAGPYRRITRSADACRERRSPGVRDDEGMTAEVTLYELAGGMAFFERLVAAFYERVSQDAALVALYPPPAPTDLGPARQRLTLFLAQYWGGPTTYSDGRGHPRLRIRHAPFPIDESMRDRWLACMRGAIDEVAPPADVEAALWNYATMAADAMRNVS